MTHQRALVELLDRPGLRSILARASTAYARKKTGADVQLFYDEGWIRRAGHVYLAEFPKFAWQSSQIAGWKAGLGDVLAAHQSWWFRYYTPTPGDVILDIGAGVGEDAIVFSQAVGPKGRVLAAEAHPGTFRLLQKTCSYNRLANVICEQKAIMDKAGSVTIEDRDAHVANRVSAAKNEDHGSVPAVSLDELCRQHRISRVDFLKMNIEGAEQFAIHGMVEMIQNTRAVCIACHDFLGPDDPSYRTRALVAEFLKQQGFKVYFSYDRCEPWARDHVHGVRE